MAPLGGTARHSSIGLSGGTRVRKAIRFVCLNFPEGAGLELGADNAKRAIVYGFLNVWVVFDICVILGWISYSRQIGVDDLLPWTLEGLLTSPAGMYGATVFGTHETREGIFQSAPSRS
jgi:hypothetical protein